MILLLAKPVLALSRYLPRVLITTRTVLNE